MKSFALASALAVFVSAQGDNTFDPNGSLSPEDIQNLIDNADDGMLISPAPNGDATAEGSGSGDGDEEDLQETLDWVHDLYKTFCTPI